MVCFDSSGDTTGKRHSKKCHIWNFIEKLFLSDTGKLLMLEDEILGLGELELLSDRRELLCFQLVVLWRLVKKSRAQCVFGLVVHIVLCCTIWSSHQVAPRSKPRDPDPWNKWPLVHKSLLTALFYKKDVWFALSEICILSPLPLLQVPLQVNTAVKSEHPENNFKWKKNENY